jgi:HlyD family secretion protein
MMKGALRVILVAAIAVGIGLVAWAFWPKPLSVETAQVTSGTFIETVEEDCRTRIRNRYEVSTPVAGRVMRPGLKAGDIVTEGDTVAVIIPAAAPLLDPRTRAEQEQRIGGAEAELAAAEADVERIRAALTQTQADVQRARTLADKGVVTLQELERRELAAATSDRDLKAAEMRRHVAEHQLEAVRSILASFSNGGTIEQVLVTAPVTGSVLQVSQTSEAAIPIGSSLLELGDPADLEVVCDVLTVDAVRIASGSPVEIERWGGPGILLGTVERVEPSGFTKVSALGVEEQRVHVVIDIASPHESWQALGDAFRVDARIEMSRTDNATLAPAGALFRRGDGWAAFALEKGIARERAVTVLGRSGNVVAIVEGLAVGESLVVFPPEDLQDGEVVRIETR